MDKLLTLVNYLKITDKIMFLKDLLFVLTKASLEMDFNKAKELKIKIKREVLKKKNKNLEYFIPEKQLKRMILVFAMRMMMTMTKTIFRKMRN